MNDAMVLKMYERMLDKQVEPTFQEMIAYCGEVGSAWMEIDTYLTEEKNVKSGIRFPYGKKYGWSVKYSVKGKLFCDIFAEANACTIMIRLTNEEMNTLNNDMSAYGKQVIAQCYPCGEGGWLYYRIIEKAQLDDVYKILNRKLR